MPTALDVPWDKIRLEFAGGMGLADLAAKYGIAFGTLSARSAREEWMQMRPETHIKSVQSVAREAAISQSGTLLARGLAYRERLFEKVAGLVEQANLPPPKNWKDIEVADRIAGRAAGIDKDNTENNIALSFWAGGAGPVESTIPGGEVLDFASEVVQDPSQNGED